MIAPPWFIVLMPWIFVWVWSTGFLVAKFGQPYAEPFTLLSIRFAAAMLVLLLIIPRFKGGWPGTPRLWLHSMLVGLLIHGIYLGGVFQAIALGMPAGLSSMVIGLQPLVMALFAGLMLKEQVTRWQWLGLVIGLGGLYLVLAERFAWQTGQIFDGFSGWSAVLVTASLMGISVGSVYQKKFCQGMNLLTSIWWQYLAAAVFCFAVALMFETRNVDWQLAFVLSLTWQVLALSIGAILLLMLMINLGESARVASLFYLVPPAVAVQAWWWFDEKLGLQALMGVGLIAVGVALARLKLLRKTEAA
ncbi:MAG TPA: EamA family transporter [Oceanospirillaceae bacterium]|nr:EamA family transporter [Oceanospirillaceae bacterium]